VHLTAKQPQQHPVRLSIVLPEKSRVGSMAASPDGSRLAVVLVKDGKQQLWVRALDALELEPLAGTEGAIDPFWSPDGRYVGFFADAKLKKVEAAGGPVQNLCDAQGGGGGTWNREGEILFSTAATGRVDRVTETGGAPSEAPYRANDPALLPCFCPTVIPTSSGRVGRRAARMQEYGSVRPPVP
jgi:Tol biopolymer transport system component